MTSEKIRRLTLPADTENLSRVMSFIDSCMEDSGCPVKAKMQIDLAVEEIFVNVASYAYAPGKGEAAIEVEPLPHGVSITFIDSGIPYDPLAKPDPDVTLSAEDRKIGGLGIFLTKKFMDDVLYRYADGHNILTLIKTF